MKVFLILTAVLAVALAAEDKYTTKFDNVDIDEILKSDRLLKNYADCLLEKRTCTPDGAELKQNVPDALQNECSKCSEKQRAGTEKVIRFLIDNKPELWEELEKKYDPEGTYRIKYRAEATKHNIKV